MDGFKFKFALRSRTAAFMHDLLAIPAAWLLAYWLRFNLEQIPEKFLATALEVLPLIIVVQGLVYVVFGLYRGVWRFASLPDLVRIAKAVFTGVIISLSLIFFITRMQHVPRSVFPLYAILLFFILAGDRFFYRWFKDSRIKKSSGTRVLIVGAGEAAELLIRDMLRQRYRQYQPVAIVDDNRKKIGRELHGIRVVGDTSEIPVLVARMKIELILIAIPSLNSEKMRRLVECCETTSVPFRTLPRFEDLVSGEVTTTALRNVSIEDLLGREKVELEWDLIRKGLSGKKIMVTGGGGSIGAELCRQIAGLKPSRLIIFERSEYNLYRINKDLVNRFPDVNVKIVLGDICDMDSVNNVFDSCMPDVIFHAAAYKQVPILQDHPREAVKNNVIGTVNVATASDRIKAEKFILISTDKAVNPSNVLGESKRLAELYCQCMGQTSKTRFITVRFGNVLGSDGSVVQLFHEQIREGGPVTVTHPDIVRYFMTIREACQLILQVAVIEDEGDVFVLDMGEPVKIVYLAEQMIRLSGKEPGRDIEICHIGLRPGEKLFEELFYAQEMNEKTGNPKVIRARHGKVNPDKLHKTIKSLERLCAGSNEGVLEEILMDANNDLFEKTVGPSNVVALPK